MEVNLQQILVLRLASVYIAQILRKYLIEQETSQSRFNYRIFIITVFILAVNFYLDLGMKRNCLVLVCQNSFI